MHPYFLRGDAVKPSLHTPYLEPHKVWLNEVVIEKVPKEEIGKSSYYLPHRSVIQKNSTTTVRPVFDASCPPFHFGSSVELPFGGNKEDISEILKNSFYVDNCVTSVWDAEELSHFIQEAKQLLAMACFDLQGWEHNYLVVGKVVETLSSDDEEAFKKSFQEKLLYYEEIFTTLSDTEATINSRSLNCLSEVPNDLTPLTPSMFIKETRAVGVPDLDNLIS
ncbi:DUF1758 domain-containing protein [Trichonephila clavipes]|nr:DUF1758 domain-containing protein [Trichonephila clavipes]